MADGVRAGLDDPRRIEAARRLLWDPLATAILNETPERASAVLFYNVFREAFLASHEGPTPFLALDRAVVAERYHALADALPGVRLFYAVKANGNRRVVEVLGPHVDGLDVSSAGELELALAAGYAAEKHAVYVVCDGTCGQTFLR